MEDHIPGPESGLLMAPGALTQPVEIQVDAQPATVEAQVEAPPVGTPTPGNPERPQFVIPEAVRAAAPEAKIAYGLSQRRGTSS